MLDISISQNLESSQTNIVIKSDLKNRIKANIRSLINYKEHRQCIGHIERQTIFKCNIFYNLRQFNSEFDRKMFQFIRLFFENDHFKIQKLKRNMDSEIQSILYWQDDSLCLDIDEYRPEMYSFGSGFMDDNLRILQKRQDIAQAKENIEIRDTTSTNKISDTQQVTTSNKSNLSTSTKSYKSSQILTRKCSCTKIRCLKNYCECFKLGIKCSQQCQCRQCCNQIQLFLCPAIITEQKIKCRCQKSKCTKKYCECHAMGKKCGKECNCIDCQNLQNFQSDQQDFPIKKVKSDPMLEFLNYFN